MSKFSKLLALAMALVMVASVFAGCGNNTQPAATQAPAATEAASEAPATEAAASRPNRVIYGSSTEVSGDMGNAWWTNNATDNMIRDLINDYAVITFDQDGAMIENPTVTAGVEAVENEDGSKTFTVKIQEGLTYNNGEPITAADFVAYALVAYAPETMAAGAGVVADTIVGAMAYQNGEVDYISGLRLVDEYTYAITIVPEMLPYFYEESYASLSPLYLPMYCPSNPDIAVADDGEGVYLTGDLVPEEINASRYIYADRVSAGPYQIVDIDTGALTATLEINPNYAGNFEGQKPSIQTIVVKKTEVATAIDALRTGDVDILNELTDGNNEINPAMDLVDAGGYNYTEYERNGYGKLQFACDVGPTQFQAVRQAVAYLLDRNEFANQFCAGYGSVTDGPYGLCMWMYKDSEEFFAENLNSYTYDPAKAVALLEEDGWTLNADGTPYSGTGIRYKEVSADDSYGLNVKLADGRVLMPLHIMWASSEANPVSELLAVMLANGQQVTDAGMKIEQTVMSFTDLLNYLYRDGSVDAKYGVPTYGMFNLATGFTQIYDQAYYYSTNEDYMGTYNNNFIRDEELAKLAWDMVYSVEPGDNAAYLDLWQKFMVRWNTLLPDVPLYSNIYYTVFADWIKGYEQSSYWSFQQAVLYATVEGAE